MQGCLHIVDDDASFPRAMERRLKQAGYEVATYALRSLPELVSLAERVGIASAAGQTA